MAGYAIITNIDKVQQPYSNYLWSFLDGFNRKSIEVTDWNKQIIGIPNSSNFGLFIGNSGNYTIFRRLKTDSTQVAYVNISIDCQVVESPNVVFTVGLILPPTDGFNFRVAIQLIEKGDNALENFEYGYSVNGGAGAEITNWQNINTFDLIDEGTYYFDVKIKDKNQLVGVQSIELTLNQDDSSNFGGGDESDNTQPGTGSSED